jgi:cation diffusion facilitator family transporter
VRVLFAGQRPPAGPVSADSDRAGQQPPTGSVGADSDRAGQPGPPAKGRAVFAALAANLAIAATKLAAALITGSAALLAESAHSLADSGNQALLLLGRRRSRLPRNERHPFGYGAERYFYAFIVAVVLFVGGSVFSLYEGVHRIMHPGRVESPAVAFGVLGVAIVLEGFSIRTAIRESNVSRGTASWRAFIQHAKAPELPAVLLEDSAALIGLVLALGGVTATELTGDGRWDGAGSAGIGVLLGCVAVILAIEMRSLLIGESAAPAAERTIVAAIEAEPSIRRVIHLRTMHLGPDSLLVAAKVAVHHDETAASVARAIDAAERRIRAAEPIATVIFLEPDLYVPARLDVTDPAVRAASRGHRATEVSGADADQPGSPAA